MALVIDRFPNIKNAYIEMVYDNGGVFNGMGMMESRTEQDALNASEPIMGGDGVYEEDLIKLDEWIGTLTKEEINTLVAGEETEMLELVSRCPTGGSDNRPLADIFNDLFEVC